MAAKMPKADDTQVEELENKRFNLGQSTLFTPNVINDIHIKSDLGRYRMRGFSMFKPIPTWDDLTFLPLKVVS